MNNFRNTTIVCFTIKANDNVALGFIFRLVNWKPFTLDHLAIIKTAQLKSTVSYDIITN